MKLLTSEQEQAIGAMQVAGVPFNMRIDFVPTTPLQIKLFVHESHAHRKLLLGIVHTVTKEKSGLDDKIVNGVATLHGMDVCLFEWDTCQVVGKRLVDVTDCELREHPELEAELVKT